MTRPRTALPVTSEDQVGPIVVADTLAASTPYARARAALRESEAALLSSLVCTRTEDEPMVVTAELADSP